MAIISALVLTIVVGMVISAMVIGRESIARREMQTAADAAALAGAYLIEQRPKPGLSVQQQWWAPAYSFVGPNSSVASGLPVFQFEHRSNPPLSNRNENRVVVRVDLQGTFDSSQAWFQRLFTVRARAYAQVNEQVFSQVWPALTIILDASQSMEMPLLGGSDPTERAWDTLRLAIKEYAVEHHLPVRSGLVIFNDRVLDGPAKVSPPGDNAYNGRAISDAFDYVENTRPWIACPRLNPPQIEEQDIPCGATNTEDALLEAHKQLKRIRDNAPTVGRNALLITDGEPTISNHFPGCDKNVRLCNFNWAKNAADKVRKEARAALFTVGIRRTNWDQQLTDLLTEMAGPLDSDGNDGRYAVPMMQNRLGVENFMRTLTASICAFGPLSPDEDDDPALPRLRRTVNPLVEWSGDTARRQRVFAFIRSPGGSETAIPVVRDRNMTNGKGFQLVTQPSDGPNGGVDHFVVLTLASCDDLGDNGENTLVVRWDEAQLVRAP